MLKRDTMKRVLPTATGAEAGAASKTVPSLISADVEMRGTFVAEGEVQFDGRIEGDIRAGGVVIGESAVVKGEVVAERVVVHGRIEGVVRAERVELAATAVIEGDVMHAALAVENGARLDGKVCCLENPRTQKRGLPTEAVRAELAEATKKREAKADEKADAAKQGGAAKAA